MDIFSKRPLFISCMLFLACSVAGYFINGNAKMIIVAFAAITLAFSLILAVLKYHSTKRRHMLLTLILCLVMVILSLWSSYLFYNVEYDKRSDYLDKELTITGIVTAVKYENNFSSAYMLSIENVNGEKDNHKAYLECQYPAVLKIGERVSANVIATETESGGKYDERLSLMSEGIFIIYLSDSEDELLVTKATDENSLELFFANLNMELCSLLRQEINGDASALSSALFLGNKTFLSDTITRDFRRVGASHFLALSGLHMSLVMGAAMLLLKQIIRKSSYIAIILSFIALFYLALTGFSVSATRSVIMLLIVYLSILISGLPDSLTSLSIAGFLIVMISPGAIVDAAFWMSFAATLGILVYMSPINNFFNECLSKYDNKFQFLFHKIIFSVISSIATSLSALLPLIVVMCIFTHEISVLSVLSSIILSFPTAVIIILTLILIPLYWMPHISTAIIYIIKIASDIMINYCADFSEFENIVLSLNYPFAVTMAVILAVALLFSFASKKFNPFLTLVPFVVSIALFIGLIWIYEDINKNTLKVSYINASTRSDILVISNEREAVICDISNGSQTSYEYALKEVADARATEIKAIMLTRYTYQHNATLYNVFQRNKVREIWIPYPDNMDEYYKMETLYYFAKKYNVSVYVFEDSEVMYPFPNIRIEHSSEYIERSAVPIDLIGIYTGKEHLTYISPAFNESALAEKAEFAFSRSRHVIFGNRGPKTKSIYSINNMKSIKTVSFSTERQIAFYKEQEFSFTAYYLVPKGKKMDYYLYE